MENKKLRYLIWCEENPHTAQCYKGLYYRYNPIKNMWDIYDDYYLGNRWLFNSDTCPIYECFNKILNNEE